MSKKIPRVLITAGASGIGLVIAKAFLAAGAQVHICDISSEAITKLALEIPAITSTLADISDIDQVDQVFEDLNRLHG
ncbi:MAG: SDR family NAD(P)-dependent oxidoreductase, partial [SAR86 cluster bacterium]